MKKALTKKKPEKRLLVSLEKKAGRANSGRITVRHQGGGAKKLYRINLRYQRRLLLLNMIPIGQLLFVF